MEAPSNTQPEENILKEAKDLVYGARNATYGHPLDDYTRTGIIWGALLRNWALEWVTKDKHATNVPVPPELACLMMCAVKMSREVNLHKRDNLVDLAGYAACVDRIHNKKAGNE